MSGPTVTIEQALRIAHDHLQNGRLAEAESISRQVLAVAPEQSVALHQLAVIAAHVGKFDDAEQLARRAISANSEDPQIWHTLGFILNRLGRIEEAIQSYREAVRLAPGSAVARLDLGNALRAGGAREEALASYRDAIRVQPTFAQAYNNLGALLGDMGDFAGAIDAYRTAIQLDPRDPRAHNNLGFTLLTTGDPLGAVAACRTALAIDPSYATAHLNLGNAMALQGDFASAIEAYRAAIDCDPGLADAHSNLGNALKDSGLIAEALAPYREALRFAPQNAILHSNLVYSLECLASPDPTQLCAERAAWNEHHAAPLRSQIRGHENDRAPERRLRVGYVSPDFCAHAISFFLLPLFRAHDRTQVEIHAYASVPRPDTITEQYRAAADVWHNVLGMGTAEMAELIRRDGIDILVDLTMHSAFNRLLVFARKPAPVQVSWLAYPGRSGLETMDWRLTDTHLEPPVEGEASGPEQPMRLADTWCSYDPLESFSAVGALPALAAGHVTFGSFNGFNKVSSTALECWARLLTAVPDARCIMVCPEGASRDAVRRTFSRHGIADSRVDLLPPMPWDEYTRLGARLDLCLDTFPYNGMTTTCHALWMGLPVVTLAGTSPVSRSGLSLLSTIGLPELVAWTEADYLRIVVGLANDLARLASLRASLRERMQSSPLMDGPGFARKIEAAYRTMWRRWCD